MSRLLTAAACLSSVLGGYLLAQSATSSAPRKQPGVMLVAASRDDQVLLGGITSITLTKQGTISIEPLARITKSGEWQDLPCRADHTSTCGQFEREFLSHAHIYKVISAEGRRAIIHAPPTKLGDCYEYTALGTYSGAEIANSAIAASSDQFFAPAPKLRLLSGREADSLRKAVVASAPEKLDSSQSQSLKLFAFSLGGYQLFAAQTSLAPTSPIWASKGANLIFSIGKLDHGIFHVLHWNEDGEERVLGIIRLKIGRDYLITTVNDSESQSFHVYGTLHGRLALVYSGDGSSC